MLENNVFQEPEWLLLFIAVISLAVWVFLLKQKETKTDEKLPGLVVFEQEKARLQAENQQLQQQQIELQIIKGESLQKDQRIQTLTDSEKAAQQRYDALQQQFNQVQSDFSALQSRLTVERESHQAQLALLENAKESLLKEFKALSADVLEQKQQQMQAQSKETLGGLIEPMQASLQQFKQRMDAVHKEDVEGRASLKEQLVQLKELNQTMSAEAQNLTKALKGDQKLQGNWGEMILKKLLESSGLREGQEFETEKSFTESSGKRLRPDVVINLPDNKHIVVDSKVSLLDYERALNAEDEVARVVAIKAHINSLTTHMKSLASKRYDHLESLNAPDFVLMFIPIEGAYMMAIEQNSAIFEQAFDDKIAVVTPTTLFTTLKTVEQLWRYERQSEHTVKLIKRAAEVHDKFVGFVDSFEKVGKQLNTAQNSYDQAKKQMLSGSGNLIRQAEMLKALAGKTKKELPAHLVENAEGQSLLDVDDPAT